MCFHWLVSFLGGQHLAQAAHTLRDFCLVSSVLGHPVGCLGHPVSCLGTPLWAVCDTKLNGMMAHNRAVFVLLPTAV